MSVCEKGIEYDVNEELSGNSNGMNKYKADSEHNLTRSEILRDSAGFSLVELLVAVAILAAIFIPVLRAFTTASLLNSRAQIIQNATSLAESYIEQVRGMSLAEVQAASGTNTAPYVLTFDNVSVTRSRKCDVQIDIGTDAYSKDSSSAGFSGVEDANIRKLPKITEVNSAQHAVISWEMNEYDDRAMDRLADENSTNEASKAAIISTAKRSGVKNVNIALNNDGGKIKITCETEYSTGSSAHKKFKYLAYTGYFDNLTTDPAGGPNIYLFYTTSAKYVGSSDKYFKNENITVTDNTSGRHNVYLILQDGVDSLNYSGGGKTSKISVSAGGTAYTTPLNLNWSTTTSAAEFILSKGADNTENTPDDVKLYTNLKYYDNGTSAFENGKFYSSEAKDRVYSVTVTVKERGSGDVLATLTSTEQLR